MLSSRCFMILSSSRSSWVRSCRCDRCEEVWCVRWSSSLSVWMLLDICWRRSCCCWTTFCNASIFLFSFDSISMAHQSSSTLILLRVWCFYGVHSIKRLLHGIRGAQSRPAQSRPAQSRPAQSRPAGSASLVGTASLVASPTATISPRRKEYSAGRRPARRGLAHTLCSPVFYLLVYQENYRSPPTSSPINI